METAVQSSSWQRPPLNSVVKAVGLTALTGTCFLLLSRPVFRWDKAFLTAPVDEGEEARLDGVPIVVRPRPGLSRSEAPERSPAVTAPARSRRAAPRERAPAPSPAAAPEALPSVAPLAPETSDRAPVMSGSAPFAPAAATAEELATAPTTLTTAAQPLAPSSSPPPSLAELTTPPRSGGRPLPLPAETGPRTSELAATAPAAETVPSSPVPLADLSPPAPPVSSSPEVAAQPAPSAPPNEQAALPDAVEDSPATEAGIFVEQFEVLGSSIFSAETLAEIAQGAALQEEAIATSGEIPRAESINRNLTLSDLVRASDAITNYYVERDYITSGAFIPADALDRDTTTIPIEIIEGSLEAVNVTLNPVEPIELSALPASISQPSADWFRVPIAPTAPTSELPETALLNDLVALQRLQQLSQAESLATAPLQVTYETWGIDQPYADLASPNGTGSPTYLAADPVALSSQFATPFARSFSTLVMRDWLDPAYTNRYIDVTVDRPLDPGYIGSRLAIAGKTPLNINQVLEGVQVLQINPIIATISTELAAGSRTGTSILNVEATQASDSQVSFSLDNNQSPSVGSIRQSAQVSQGNLSGLGDRLAFGANRTEGSRSFDLSYAIPISPHDTTLRFSFSDSNSEILTEAFSALDIQTDSTLYEIALEQPIVKTPTQQVTLSLIGSYRESQSEFLQGVPFPATGADADGFTRVAALRFAQDWLSQGESQVFALRSQFSLGLDSLGATVNEDPPDTNFLSWRGRAQYARLFAPDTLLLLRGDVQLSDRPLVPNEQIGLGGQATVRGYRQNSLLTDNGWLASAELRLPVLRIPEIEGILQVSPFFDIGQGWNHPDSPAEAPDPDLISGAGLGLIWRQGDYLTARLDWGIPLNSIDYDTEEGTLQESGIYFSITFTP